MLMIPFSEKKVKGQNQERWWLLLSQGLMHPRQADNDLELLVLIPLLITC